MSVHRVRHLRGSIIPLDVDDDGVTLSKAEILDGADKVRLVRTIRVQVNAVARTINGVIFVVDVTLIRTGNIFVELS